jgi:hypothetical protein
MTIKGELPRELREMADRIEQARTGQQQPTIDKAVDLQPSKQVQLSPLEWMLAQNAHKARSYAQDQPQEPERTQDRERGIER